MKEPFDYTGWLIRHDINILGRNLIGQPGTGPGGRIEEGEYRDTPWGEVALANVETHGRASDQDYTMKQPANRGTQAGGGDTQRTARPTLQPVGVLIGV